MTSTRQQWATSVVTTSGSTWAVTSDALGPNQAVRATFTSATNAAVGFIKLGFVGLQKALNNVAPTSVDSIDVTVWSSETGATSRWTSATAQAEDPTAGLLGSATSLTLSVLATNSQTVNMTGANCPTWAQLADGFMIRLTATKSGTTSSVYSIDAVKVVVNCTGGTTYVFQDFETDPSENGEDFYQGGTTTLGFIQRPASSWSSYGLQAASTVNHAHSGTNGLGGNVKLTPVDCGAVSNVQRVITTGQTVSFTIWVVNTSGNQTALRVFPVWYDASHVELSDSMPGSDSAITQNTWTQFTGTGTAPASAAFWAPAYRISAAGTTGLAFWSFDDLVITSFYGTATLSGSGSLTTVDVPSVAAAPSLSGSGTLSASIGPPNFVVSPALSGSGSLTTGTGKPALVTTAVLTGSGTLTSSAVVAFPGLTATLSGSGTLTVTGIPGGVAAPSLTGSGVLSTGTGTPALVQTAALSGSGVLSAVALVNIPNRTATLAGSGTLTTSDLVGFPVSAALSGSGVLTTGTGLPALIQTVALTGSGTLATGAGHIQVVTTVALAGAGTLTVLGIPGGISSPSLTGSGTLSTSIGPPGFTSSPALSGSGVLTTSVIVQFAVTAALSGTGVLSTNALNTITLSGSGTLSTGAGLPFLVTTVALTGSGALTASVLAVFPGTAALGGEGTLVGVLQHVRIRPVPVAFSGDGALTVISGPGVPTTVLLSGEGILSAIGVVLARITVRPNTGRTLFDLSITPRPNSGVSEELGDDITPRPFSGVTI